MYTLKLIQGLSYRGGIEGKVRATKGKPCTVTSAEEAEALIATGHFELVSVSADESGSGGEKTIDKMSKDELAALAAEKCIDISSCKNNDERKQAIKAALTAGPSNTAGTGDGDGEKTGDSDIEESSTPAAAEEQLTADFTKEVS